MKKTTVYQIITVALCISSVIALCSADSRRRELESLKSEESRSVEKVISENLKEISYNLSVMYWSADQNNYKCSKSNITAACGEIMGAIKVYPPKKRGLYNGYCSTMSAYILSLPERPDRETREKCLTLRDMQNDVFGKEYDAGVPEGALADLIEKTDELTHRDSRYSRSWAGV